MAGKAKRKAAKKKKSSGKKADESSRGAKSRSKAEQTKKKSAAGAKAKRKRGPKKKRPKSYGGNMDPRLSMLMSRAGREKKGELGAMASRLGAKGFFEVLSFDGFPVGLHSLASQGSEQFFERLDSEDLVELLLLIDDAEGDTEKVRNHSKAITTAVEKVKGSARSLSATTIAVRCPRKRLRSLGQRAGVRYVEANSVLRPHLDLAHRSAQLQTASGGWTITRRLSSCLRSIRTNGSAAGVSSSGRAMPVG